MRDLGEAVVMPETPQDAYDRGEVAGQIAARLAGHDQHLAKINGSMGDVARELRELRLAVERLTAQATARDESIATARETDAAARQAEIAAHLQHASDIRGVGIQAPLRMALIATAVGVVVLIAVYVAFVAR